VHPVDRWQRSFLSKVIYISKFRALSEIIKHLPASTDAVVRHKLKRKIFNTMEFIPAGEIIGEAHQVRTVSIKQSPQLPDGEYSFIDMYCADPECDCRKTMIQVMHNERLVSIINYGWEAATFYDNWMGSTKDNQMHGASIDLTSPNLVRTDGILALFNALLNDIWVAKFKHHYNEVKAAVSKRTK
jgi:hypothetical protein